MSSTGERELEVLRNLAKQYGERYFHAYFGVSFKEIAKRSGMSVWMMSRLLNGHKPIKPQYREAFCRAFAELGIEQKAANFKETPLMLWRKKLNRAQRNCLTTIAIFTIMSIAMGQAIFLKPTSYNFQEYLVYHRRITCNLVAQHKAACVENTHAAFLFFNSRATKSRINLTRLRVAQKIIGYQSKCACT